MTSVTNRVALLVDDASVANMRTQLRLLRVGMPDSYLLDLFYHESCPTDLQNQFEVHQVSLGGTALSTQNPVLQILSRILSFSKQVRNYINDYEPEAVIGFTNPPVMGTAAGLAASKTSTTAIYRYSGDSFREYEYAPGVSKYLSFGHYNIIGRMALKTCNEYIVLGPNGQARLSNRGINEGRIHVIPPAINDDRFYPGESSLGIQTDSPTGIFVGRLTKRKGVDILKEIIKQTSGSKYDINFLVVGRGPMADELAALSEDRVHLTGYVPHSQLPEYYRAADFLLHPSKIEGLPNVLLEAHACGLPSITSPAGEMPYFSCYTAETVSDYLEKIQRINVDKHLQKETEDSCLNYPPANSYSKLTEILTQ